MIYISFSWCPDQPLVFRLDLEDLHFPLLLSVESFGFFVFPLWRVLVPCITKNQGFVTQHILWVMSWLRLNAFFQEGLCESLCFRPGARLKMTLTFWEMTRNYWFSFSLKCLLAVYIWKVCNWMWLEVQEGTLRTNAYCPATSQAGMDPGHQGPVSEIRFSENSECINPEIRETKRGNSSPFQKEK